MNSSGPQPWSATVDVIVPVYRGEAETRAAIESVLASTPVTPFNLLVVDDATPEPGLAAWLDELAADGRIELLRHARNQGFVRSVNHAMSRHPDRDVVLLNSDTTVHGDWLDRLRHCAWNDPDAGTVTPLSNNATLASYPRFMADNALPEGYDAAAMDALCARVNAGCSVAIPTAVGFCMYIRRDCLNATGYFDAQRFGRGYGEENDFCRRAAELGYVHRLCGAVFVWHKGSVSFGNDGAHWRQRGGEAMRQAHPDYEALIAEHVRADPQRPLRRRLDLARLAASPRPRILAISHRQGGGVARHLSDMARLLHDDVELLQLTPADDGHLCLSWLRAGEEDFALWFRWPFEREALLDMLRELQIGRVHVHHVMEIPLAVLRLAETLGVPWDFTVHDHYPICPQYNLTDEVGDYCGEPDETGCSRCLAMRPAPWGLDILSWREQFRQWLRTAERVFVPSRITLARMHAYCPEANYRLLPHPEPDAPCSTVVATAPAADDGVVRVLILGVLNPAKGAGLLGRCAWDARRRGLPLEFRVVGWFETPIAGVEQLPVTWTGPYQPDQLQTLVAEQEAHVLFYPTRAPETWSYTLTEGLATGLPIVAPARGALLERLAGHERAHLAPPDQDAGAWNDALLAWARRDSGGAIA